jgi:hypothetical protein
MGGSFFIRKSREDLSQMLETEQKTLEIEKEKTRQQIKTKALELSTMEGKVSTVAGYFLKPLDKGDSIF